MQGGVWPLEELRPAVASVDFDRLVLDQIAAAAGMPAVVVDVGDDPADDVGTALAALPVVSVAVGSGGEAWDLTLDDPGPALEGLRANPQASVVAAQTLRRNARLGLLDALLVESLAYATLQAGPEHARWLAQRGRRTRRDIDQPRIEVTDDGASVTVSLSRPRLLNLFDAAMRDQLVDVLKALQAAADDRPVVLTGAGGNFCAGGDPAEFGSVENPASRSPHKKPGQRRALAGNSRPPNDGADRWGLRGRGHRAGCVLRHGHRHRPGPLPAAGTVNGPDTWCGRDREHPGPHRSPANTLVAADRRRTRSGRCPGLGAGGRPRLGRPGRRPGGYLWTKVWARGACSKPEGAVPVVA